MSTVSSSSSSSSNMDPYGTTPVNEKPTYSPVSQDLNTNTIPIYGVGVVPVQPTGVETSSEVQEAWNEQMAIITDIITKLNTEPVQLDPGDLDSLVNALNELVKLATQGITDENGQTYYLTEDMAEALSIMLYEFAAIGITPGMNTKGMTDEAKIALLQGASNPTTDPYEDPLQVAVMNAANNTYEDVGFQSYIYLSIMDIINSQTVELEQLNEYLAQSDEILNILNDLIEISSYTEPPEPWEYDMTLDNPGDVPPAAVPEIQTYMEENGASTYALGFQDQYEKEMEIAEDLAEQNGTTVEEEMKKMQGGEGSSCDMLKSFIIEDKESEDVAVDIMEIMADNVVNELNSVPTAPDGMTMVDVAEDIWVAKLSLEAQIDELNARGAEELADSLEVIVADMEEVWEQTLIDNGLPPDLLPEEVIIRLGHDADKVFEQFAENYISSIQPGQENATHLDTGVLDFTNWNEELQKEFQKLMTLIEALMKFAGQMLAMSDKIAEAYIKNYNA